MPADGVENGKHAGLVRVLEENLAALQMWKFQGATMTVFSLRHLVFQLPSRITVREPRSVMFSGQLSSNIDLITPLSFVALLY